MKKKDIVLNNFEQIKKEYLESEMTLNELGTKWGVSRYDLSRYLKKVRRPYRKNFLGKRYGRLTVIQFLGSADKNGLWLCRCDCGNDKKIISKQLPLVNSCGCLQKEFARGQIKKLVKPLDENSLSNNKFLAYKHRAKAKNIVFTLDQGNCRDLFKGNCFYCHSEPFQFIENKTGAVRFYYNGIDRVDNSKGYEIGNVVSCCGICNRSKSEMSVEEFLTWVRKVASIQK